jgi:hypothetical protein
MVDECPACGLVTDRGESGYVVGAYLFNMIGSELLFVAAAGAVILATWPHPPWTAISIGGPMLMLGFPVLLYPYCRSLFLGFDLLVHPEVEPPDHS